MGTRRIRPFSNPQTKLDLPTTMKTFTILCLVAVSVAYFGDFEPDHNKEACFGFCDHHDICAEDRKKGAEDLAVCNKKYPKESRKPHSEEWWNCVLNDVHDCRNTKKWADCMRACEKQHDNFDACTSWDWLGCVAALEKNVKV